MVTVGGLLEQSTDHSWRHPEEVPVSSLSPTLNIVAVCGENHGHFACQQLLPILNDIAICVTDKPATWPGSSQHRN